MLPKRHFLFLVFPFLLFACKDDIEPANTCAVANPIEELDWLASEIQILEQSGISQFLYVSQAEYKNMTVFIFGNCCPNCNTIVPVRNCAGDLIGTVGDDEIDPSILSTDIIIWKPDDFVCFE